MFYRVGSEWKWTDGTMMNKALITKGGPNSLWFLNNPSGDGKGMEIIEQRPYGDGINDLSKSKAYHYARSYVCKIPCSKGNIYFVVL